jgi:hypothetical protein
MSPEQHAHELARTLHSVMHALENWMEIADRDDKRDSDQQAIDDAQKALDAWNRRNAPPPKQSLLI